MKIISDGTSRGTKLYDDAGEQMHNVVALQRQGKHLYVTTRVWHAEDVEMEGLPEGDFSLAVSSKFQPVVANA